MIKTHKRVISLMTVTALSSLALANAAMTSTVQAETLFILLHWKLPQEHSNF
ncbi:hypothetical protein [Streptococcus dysgalactiae]|uniref:Cell wall surface anchor family protein n=1 Tax=Streptococcus dysgalactiae subsp. equisimilis TaxID=119602 RepID=A0A9X8SZ55_STREQ|nr:hypothetical protein [Streptococcus dysgalactiae]MDO5365273.1 hypothetical protein [Streptococcus dysgalactiae]SQF66795.1 cell wall surface anchor family protein [Streptococcus dysgalactiae subsp. equisimilis]VEF07877.1 cell wall surface anchor family protein [Streptococcus dysgalactiae subsp. equisimilis]